MCRQVCLASAKLCSSNHVWIHFAVASPHPVFGQPRTSTTLLLECRARDWSKASCSFWSCSEEWKSFTSWQKGAATWTYHRNCVARMRDACPGDVSLGIRRLLGHWHAISYINHITKADFQRSQLWDIAVWFDTSQHPRCTSIQICTAPVEIRIYTSFISTYW